MNSDTLARFCTRRIGRADSDVPNRPVNVNYQGRQACILEVPFLSFSSPIKRLRKFAKPSFHSCFSCFLKNSQTNFCLYTLLYISDVDEFVFGPYRYLFDRAPPQPNCPPIAVPKRLVTLSRMGSVTILLHSSQRNYFEAPTYAKHTR